MKPTIDLRSDTVTKPTPGMRHAMFDAEVGDDVFGEDPTVNRLQTVVADMLQKEAALFVPSGVMGNQLAIKSQTNGGDEVIVEASSHILNYESGATGVLSGVQLRTLQGVDGVVTVDQIEGAIRAGYYWEPQSRLICLENTMNKAGGMIFPIESARQISEVARSRGLLMHLDGARLWNASISTGLSPVELAAPFDTVSVCLSKGLGAPIGSVLAGPAETIKKAHRYRKMFGAGMRQVGILAAAGLYALEFHRDRLADDHQNARVLAEGMNRFECFSVKLENIQSNIVMIDTGQQPASDVLEKLSSLGILMVPFGPTVIRATTHLGISARDIEFALTSMSTLFH